MMVRPAASAFRAGLQVGNLDFDALALDRVFKLDLEVVTDIVTAPGPVLVVRRATKQVAKAEEIAKDVPEVSKNRGVKPAAGDALHPLVAKMVVRGAFVRITENAVGFRSLFKMFFGLVVARVPVRMVLEGELTIRSLQPLLIHSPVHSENLVIIPFGHLESPLTSRRKQA